MGLALLTPLHYVPDFPFIMLTPLKGYRDKRILWGCIHTVLIFPWQVSHVERQNTGEDDML